MKVAELREKLHEYIERADKELLELMAEIFEADRQHGDWWDELSDSAKQAIMRAKVQLEQGHGVDHELVMREIRAKYGS